ncbi:hypothetical protein Ddye_022074 [Dipteronia dyeriana]|uniref:PGG domain-containing protein n=1 Tax=Dipteronia dyeriana TaxID=168575 RepID=A0AAD9U3V2_9ROSI|nr:hypothetical protein Ddye_022074 [Dipteronia dyeriana]
MQDKLQRSTLVVSSGGVPLMDAHHAQHTIQMADIVIHLQTTQAPQNQLINHSPPEPNSPLLDLLPRQKATIVVSTLAAVSQQIDSHDTVLTAESTDAHPMQAPQNQQNHAPIYQLNLPDRSLLPSQSENRDQYRLKCLPLKKFALAGNFNEAQPLLGDESDDHLSMLRTAITEMDQTVLHVATGARQVGFVEEIIKLMESDDLKLQDRNGNTAFCFAAAVGSIEIVKLMLDKNPDLLTLRGADNKVPLYMAALFGKTEMAKFLYDSTESQLTDQVEADLFFKCINTYLYDIALKLLEHQPRLAVTRDEHEDTALHVLPRKPSSLFARRRIGIFKRLAYSIREMNTHNRELVSSPALELVKCLEGAIEEQKANIEELIRTPSSLLFDAAKSGNFEFLAELVHSYPDLVHLLDEQERSIFHIAILHRHTNIFNLIYGIGFDKEVLATYKDNEGNTMLHLAAKYTDPPPVSNLPGPALEMQQELLMFEEVEMIMKPSFREIKNAEGRTPRELFTVEHKKLLHSGEKWMKSTATSCMVVATLIATVVFSAAFTAPGGNNEETGIPLRLMETAFHVFAISDAIALSFSSISILMFLSILTSGYTEMDFQRSLPLKLMVGLWALFISVIAMMITFGSTFFLVYHDRSDSIPVVTFMFVSVPITLFIILQYPLLRDILCSTCRSRFLSTLAK